MINLVRVDYRLLHGQVVYSWLKNKPINHIIIADDKAATDSFAQMALKLAKPSNCKLDIVQIKDARQVYEKAGNKNFMFIVKGVSELYQLLQFIPEINEVNYGGVPQREGTKQVSKTIFLTPEEIELTKAMIDDNIKIYVQQLPSSPIEKMELSR